MIMIQGNIANKIGSARFFLRNLLLALSIIIISVIAQNTLVLRLALGEVEALRIGFGALFTLLGGIWLGPLWGAFIGGISDLTSFAFYPAGEYLPQITLVSALRGALPGLLKKLTSDFTRVRSLIVLVGTPQIICSVILMPLILYHAFAIPIVDNISTRLLTQAFTIPLYVLVLYILLNQWKAGEALQESEEKHRSIFEFSPLGIVHFDDRGIVTDCNKAMVDLTGSNRRKVKGLNLFNLPDKSIVAALSSSLEGKHGFFEGKYLAVSPQREIYVRAFFNPIIIKNKVCGGAGIIEDISDKVIAEEKLKFLADTDELTGLYNRRYFKKAVQVELERARRYGQGFSLVMLDIDNFKSINDTYGHDAGDAVLQQVSHVLQKRLRQVDVLGRLGGEEFCMMLPGTFPEDAVHLAEEVRKKIEETPFKVTGRDIYLTISLGVTAYREGITDVDMLLKMVDKAMYNAKDNGKNCTKQLVNL